MSNETPRTTATLDTETEYVDRSLATASWWDKFTLLPGTYPVEYVTINHTPTTPEDSYYGVIMVDAILTESYRVNRLFQHSHAVTDYPNTKTKVMFRIYSYYLRGNSHTEQRSEYMGLTLA